MGPSLTARQTFTGSSASLAINRACCRYFFFHFALYLLFFTFFFFSFTLHHSLFLFTWFAFFS